jgi:predicted NAD/FAD-binding protein
MFDTKAIAAQNLLPNIQGKNKIWYCGAWTGYGFHEDGFKSGELVANQIIQNASFK